MDTSCAENYITTANSMCLGISRINSSLFSKTVDWLHTAPKDLCPTPGTLLLAFQIFNRYSVLKPIPNKELQLYGVCACFIAASVLDDIIPDLAYYMDVRDCEYTDDQIDNTTAKIFTEIAGNACIPNVYTISLAIGPAIYGTYEVTCGMYLDSKAYTLDAGKLAGGVHYYLNLNDLGIRNSNYCIYSFSDILDYVYYVIRSISKLSRSRTLLQEFNHVFKYLNSQVPTDIRNLTISSEVPKSVEFGILKPQANPQSMPDLDNQCIQIGIGTAGTVYKSGKFAYKTQDWSIGMSEISIMQALKHPNIQAALVFGFPNTSELILQMDLQETLWDSIIADEPITSDLQNRYMRELMSGLAYIHSAGIIHGDIKLENILLTHNHHIRITDFGSSIPFIRGIGDTKSQRPSPRSTAYYRDPAAFRGQPAWDYYSTEIDVWAMGILFIEILTNQLAPVRTALEDYCDTRTDAELDVLNEDAESVECNEFVYEYIRNDVATGHIFQGLEDSMKPKISRLLDMNRNTRITAKAATQLFE